MCECDLQLTLDLSSAVYNPLNSHGLLIDKKECTKKSRRQILKCCALRRGLFSVYNARTSSCCDDGLVVPIGTC